MCIKTHIHIPTGINKLVYYHTVLPVAPLLHWKYAYQLRFACRTPVHSLRSSAPPAWTTTTRLPLALPMPRRLRRPPRVPRQCRPRVCQACARAGAGRAIITASCVCYSMFYEYMLRAHTSTRTSSARCALPPPSKCGRSPSQSLRILGAY